MLSPVSAMASSSPAYAAYVAVAVLTAVSACGECSNRLGAALCFLTTPAPVIAAILVAFVVLSDPGILPRSAATAAPELGLAEAGELVEIGSQLSRMHMAAMAAKAAPGLEWPEVSVAARLRGVAGSVPDGRFCRTCLTLRPADVHHCSTTGACIAGFDHYCGVLGKPIGRGNHRAFIGAIFTTGVGSLLITLVHGLTAILAIVEAAEAAPASAFDDPNALVATPALIFGWVVVGIALLGCLVTCGPSGGLSLGVILPTIAGSTLGTLSAVVPGLERAVLPACLALGLLLLGPALVSFTLYNVDLACTGDSTKARIHRERERRAEAARHMAVRAARDPSLASASLPAAATAAAEPYHEAVQPSAIVRVLCCPCTLPPCGPIDPCMEPRARLAQWEVQSCTAFCVRGWGSRRRIDWKLPVQRDQVEASLTLLRATVAAAKADVDAAEAAAKEGGGGTLASEIPPLDKSLSYSAQSRRRDWEAKTSFRRLPYLHPRSVPSLGAGDAHAEPRTSDEDEVSLSAEQAERQRLRAASGARLCGASGSGDPEPESRCHAGCLQPGWADSGLVCETGHSPDLLPFADLLLTHRELV